MKRRLAIFVVGSCLVHATVLLAAGMPAAWFGGQRLSVLSVSLTGSEVDSRPARAPLAAHRASAGGGSAKVSATDAHNAAASSPALAPDEPLWRTPEPAPAAAAPADGNSVGQQAARARIQARLRALLDRYFEYPYAARLRGWEGEVRLRLRVLADGRLEGLHVARSSGFAVLDDSALDSLARVGRIEEAVAWLNGGSLEMQIAVVYRLRDGS